MSRTVVYLGDQLVSEVATALGTGTKKETVNTARSLSAFAAPSR